MQKGSRKVQYLVALSASTASFTMGVISAWTTPVIPKLNNNETDIEIDKHQMAWMLSMGPIGFIVGSFVTGLILDRIGRRGTILWSGCPYFIAMIIVATAVKAWLLFVTMFLWSFGTAMLSNVLIVYFAEISDKDIRGNISLLTRIAFNFGGLVTMCIGPLISYENLNRAMVVLPVVSLLACWWIPESPYYYLKDNKSDAAVKVLIKLRGVKDEKTISDELSRMQAQVKNEMRRSTSPKELFSGKQYRTAIIISVGLKITQIMTGAMTIQSYIGLIMEESAVTEYMKLSNILIIFGAVRFFVSIMPSVMADTVGRRPLLIYSYAGTGISLTIVGIYFFLLDVVQIDRHLIIPYGFITFLGIIFSNIISTIGYNSIVMLIPGEIFPMNVKASAMSSLSVFGGVIAFIVARGYQILKDLIGLSGVFWVFATVAFLGAIFSLVYVPETKGKSLEEIQMQLQGDLYLCREADKLNEIQIDDDVIESKELEVLNKKPD